MKSLEFCVNGKRQKDIVEIIFPSFFTIHKQKQINIIAEIYKIK